jgi:hypothetical protein
MKKIETDMAILLGMGSAIADLLIEKKIITRKELIKKLAEVVKETEKNLLNQKKEGKEE